MTPTRIQRARIKGWRMPAGAVYVGRGTPWGNPFKVGNFVSEGQFEITPKLAVDYYRMFLDGRFDLDDRRNRDRRASLAHSARWCLPRRLELAQRFVRVRRKSSAVSRLLVFVRSTNLATPTFYSKLQTNHRREYDDQRTPL